MSFPNKYIPCIIVATCVGSNLITSWPTTELSEFRFTEMCKLDDFQIVTLLGL